MGRRRPWSPGRIVAVYVVLSLAWAGLTGPLVLRLVGDPRWHEGIRIVNRAAFVVLSSLLLYALIRRSESEVRRFGAELRSAFDNMADGLLLVDSEMRVVDANRAAVELLGVASKKDLLGPLEDWARRFALRYPDASPVPFERYATRRALAGEAVVPYEGIMRRADGRELFVSISAAPLAGMGLAVTVIRDISAARRLEEVRDEFLATAAHELKTPLAVIKAYAQLVERRAPADAQPLAAIERQVDRLDRLVQHLLDTSRLHLEGEARRERLDLGVLAREVVDRARRGAPRHTFTVEAPAPVMVSVDRARLARVVAGLLDNSVRFSPAGGPVAVRVEVDTGEAVLSVTDRGVGIPREQQARVFERYYHAHGGGADDSAGIGLTLEVSRAIVERHGGRMTFESVAGQGSTFFVHLPLAAGA